MPFRLKPTFAAPFAAVSLASLSLAACGQSEPAPKAPANEAAATAPKATATFDLSGVPVSTAPLAAAPPYFSAPDGYRVEASGAVPATVFPVWLGGDFQLVEGNVHWSRLSAVDSKAFSRVALSRAIDAMVKSAGGVEVASGQASQAAVNALPEAMRQELLDALGDHTNSPTTTYVIRRADKTIWVHVVVSVEVAYLSTVDAPPYAGTPSS